RLALGARDGDQVHIKTRAPDDFLRFGNAAHGDDAIADARGRFIIIRVGGAEHFMLEAAEQRFLLAFTKEHDFFDHAIVFLLRLTTDTRRQTPLDVILQARAAAPAVDG